MSYKFEIFKDKKGEFRFRLKAPNGQIMFSGEGYKQKASALKAIISIKNNIADADIDDQVQNIAMERDGRGGGRSKP